MKVWFWTMWPSWYSLRTRSGWAVACAPVTKKVAFTFWAASTSSILGVSAGSGPSSTLIAMILSGAGVVLMVQVRVAGVASTLPAASVARTEKVWDPLARPV